MPEVRVIIVAYNSGPLLAQALDALGKQTHADFECIIFDNASTDGWPERALPIDPRFRLVKSAENLGFAAANNRAAVGAETEFLALLNPDAVPEPSWLAALLRAARRYPSVCMFGSCQISLEDPAYLDGLGDCYGFMGVAWRGGHGHPRPRSLNDFEVFAPCGAAAFYRRKAFEAAGGFAEHFFCLLEDVELGFRMRIAGGSCVQIADAIVSHYGSAVIGRASAFTVYHVTRNQLWTFLRCQPLPLLFALAPAYVIALVYQAVRNARRGHLRDFLKGLRDGVAGAPRAFGERRDIHRAGKASFVKVARSFTWSPRKILGRQPDLRPIGVGARGPGGQSSPGPFPGDAK